MALKAFEDFAPEPLAFPIGGKVYTVPPVGYLQGIRLQNVLAGTDHTLDGAKPDELWKFVMGTAWTEMVADNVPMEALSRAGFATITDFQLGREAASRAWESGIDPEALAAALTAASHKTDPPKPTNTAAAAKTRSRASSSGTSSPKVSSTRAPKAKASRS